MGGFSSRQVQEIKENQHPHFDEYLKCQSTAFVMGLGSCVSGAAAILVGQFALRKFVPINQGLMISLPMVGGTAVGYIVTRNQTQNCQNMWMALEDKHTYLDRSDHE